MNTNDVLTKLIAEIERLGRNWDGVQELQPASLFQADLYELLSLIDSLQQDFPTTDEQVKKFLAAHPKIEVPEKYKNPDWLFKQQEQPEVDCDELDEAAQKYSDNYCLDWSYSLEYKDAFIAGAEWQYQKDRGEFAKLKAKQWCNGYDDAVSQFVKIPYEPRDWFSSKDGDFICGASFDEAIPTKVELYYRTKLEEK